MEDGWIIPGRTDLSGDRIGSGPPFFLAIKFGHLDVSKNIGTAKWMVKIMENPIKMDDLGVPLFLETPIWKGNNPNPN